VIKRALREIFCFALLLPCPFCRLKCIFHKEEHRSAFASVWSELKSDFRSFRSGFQTLLGMETSRSFCAESASTQMYTDVPLAKLHSVSRPVLSDKHGKELVVAVNANDKVTVAVEGVPENFYVTARVKLSRKLTSNRGNGQLVS